LAADSLLQRFPDAQMDLRAPPRGMERARTRRRSNGKKKKNGRDLQLQPEKK